MLIKSVVGNGVSETRQKNKIYAKLSDMLAKYFTSFKCTFKKTVLMNCIFVGYSRISTAKQNFGRGRDCFQINKVEAV